MTYFKPTIGTFFASVTVAAVGLMSSASAGADELYKADRAYCMSGQATEARSLCLKEAAAAQADRQRRSHVAEKGNRKYRS